MDDSKLLKFLCRVAVLSGGIYAAAHGDPDAITLFLRVTDAAAFLSQKRRRRLIDHLKGKRRLTSEESSALSMLEYCDGVASGRIKDGPPHRSDTAEPASKDLGQRSQRSKSIFAGRRQEKLRLRILHLVRAIAEIPYEERIAWRDELAAELDNGLVGDENLVFMVLNNLPVAERLAGRPEPKPRPKLVSLKRSQDGEARDRRRVK